MFLPVALLLIAGLASDDFDTREACQEALSLCPELAEPVVWGHYLDPEVNHRLQVARQGYDPPWLLGKWRVTNDTGLTYIVVIYSQTSLLVYLGILQRHHQVKLHRRVDGNILHQARKALGYSGNTGGDILPVDSGKEGTESQEILYLHTKSLA
jgi:hypothetical protein